MPGTDDQLGPELDKIEAFVKGFKLPTSSYRRAMQHLKEEMDYGLAKATHHLAEVKMFPTFVQSLPDGTENGDFLALDLGGTNFRVLLVRLAHGQETEIKSKAYVIPQRIALGTGTQLFDHIADCTGNFLLENNLSGQTLPLGFTFSFPLKQEGLAKARLSHWSKGFRCEGVVGEDVCALLQEALKRRTSCNVEIIACVNDTAGTLMSAAHIDHNCEIGLIVGTGCNACYMEYLTNVETWEGEKNPGDQVIINMEWGAFGGNGCLDYMLTEYDRDLDTYSINPSKQIMEKMIGGMYMGEVVRLVLERLTTEGLLFSSVDKESDLFKRDQFFTKYVSEIESDTDEVFGNTKQVLEQIGVDKYTTDDCKVVKYVCTLISERGAFLAAAGLATLINRRNKPNMTIAVDGSLYRCHPRFHELLRTKVQELINPGLKFKLLPAHDGSGLGVALTAAASLRLHNTKHTTGTANNHIGVKQVV